jgi:hypothetical protein
MLCSAVWAQSGFVFNRVTPKVVSAYAASGWSAHGPAQVSSISSGKITLMSRYKWVKGMEILLTGKNVTVWDTAGKKADLSIISEGSFIWIATKKSNVVLYLVDRTDSEEPNTE